MTRHLDRRITTRIPAMTRHEIDREASDADRTDPQRAVASLQGIAAAWLLVLAVGAVAVLPGALHVAEHSALRTVHVARLEINGLAHEVPRRLLSRRPSLSPSEAFAADASHLSPGTL